MKPIRRILFAVRNPDAPRQPGIVKAIHIAAGFGASLELFHALSTPVSLEVQPTRKGHALEDVRRNAVAHAEGRLARFAAAAHRQGVSLTSSVTWDYPPHEAVVRRAANIEADLIVAECHKGTRTRAWLIHLTDWELLRTSSLPVLLLKNGRLYRRPVALAAVDPAHHHAKPAELDARIVATAREVSEAFRGSMQVMHANHPSVFGLSLEPPHVDATSLTLTYADLRRQARLTFDHFRRAAGVAGARAHLIEGDPAAEIPRAARKLRASIVIMGAVSRTGLERVFIGNTAERVLNALPCDVLVVKPEGFESHVTGEPRGMRMTMPPPFAPMPV
ncbi:MAG: universal stress protein [Pseudomonadota bacterium]